jgi:hypothetical protein
MVVEECPPGLRGLGTPSRHEAGHGALGHFDAELQEFAMDSGAPHSGFALAVPASRVIGTPERPVLASAPSTGRFSCSPRYSLH